MSLIEQAALRLDQLRRAGAEVPDGVEPGLPGIPAAAAPAPKPAPAAESRAKRIVIDLDALGAAGYITPQSPRSQIADEFRVIKRPLIANAMGKGAAPVANGNLILVTSAVPGEGKTFTAINLAMSIAMELDTTVMLVDADVAKPSVLQVLGLPSGPGLLEVLLNESLDLSEVLLRTNVEKLTLLPAGTQHARATEVLASDAMVKLLEDMAKRYDDRIIIFDSPPLLATTESRVLASHMGQIVIVTRAEHTLHGHIKQALAAIENCPVKLMVLNQACADPMGSYGYGYGYGQGFGPGYGQGHDG